MIVRLLHRSSFENAQLQNQHIICNSLSNPHLWRPVSLMSFSQSVFTHDCFQMSDMTTGCRGSSHFLRSQALLPLLLLIQRHMCPEGLLGWAVCCETASGKSERSETRKQISCQQLETLLQFVVDGHNIVIYCTSHGTSHEYMDYILYIQNKIYNTKYIEKSCVDVNLLC